MILKWGSCGFSDFPHKFAVFMSKTCERFSWQKVFGVFVDFQETKFCAGISASQTNTTVFYKYRPNLPTLLCCFTANYCGWKGKTSFASQRRGKTLSWQKPRHRAGLSRDGHIHVTARWEMLSRFALNNYREERVSLWMEWGLLLQRFVHRECLEALQAALAALPVPGCAVQGSSAVALGWFGLKCGFSTVHRLPVLLLKFQVFHIWRFLS